MTFQLLTTSEGKKMGKTQKGAVWLDASKTSPYDFYQYWRNVDDGDVEKCMKLLTFMPLDEIEELCSHKDERINAAKARLAYEVTAIVHGEQEASKAQAQAQAAFSGDDANMPSMTLPQGVTNIVDVLATLGLCKSKSEARQLIAGGGIRVNEDKISDIAYCLTAEQLASGFVLHKGKKVHVKVSAQ